MGYIGLPTATMFSCYGHKVIGVDVNEKVVNNINKGKIIIDGKEGSALNLFLLRGNFLTILKKLEVIGNDSYLNLKEGFYECPSIAVGKLQVDNI